MIKNTLIALALLLLLNGCTVPLRILRYNKPSIEDKKVFPTQIIQKSSEPFHFLNSHNKQLLPDLSTWLESELVNEYETFDDFFEQTHTTAFLVIRNDSILYENYFNGYKAEKSAIIFSINKAISTALIGIAIEEGYLRGPNQRVVEFIPAFAKDGRRNITLDHLMQMTSGLNFDDYGSIIKLAKVYYNTHLERVIEKSKLKHQPGTHFAYKSIDTQILTMCLNKALEKKGSNIQQYLEEKIWQPLGMEFDAYLTLDRKDGNPRMYGGIVACTRDLAKIGRLYKNEGAWNGQQIVPKTWIKKCVTIDPKKGWWGYSTGWWFNEYYIDSNLTEKDDFFASGYNGQLLYINPSANIIIVRQGYKKKDVMWPNSVMYLAKVLNNEPQEYWVKNKVVSQNRANVFSGTYKNKAGKTIKVRNKGKYWRAKGRGLGRLFGEKLHQESPRSICDNKKKKRLILEKTGPKTIGLYFDDLRKATFFEKVEKIE